MSDNHSGLHSNSDASTADTNYLTAHGCSKPMWRAVEAQAEREVDAVPLLELGKVYIARVIFSMLTQLGIYAGEKGRDYTAEG